MKLAYKAVDRTGNVTSDSIEATSATEASEKLRQRGLFVTEIGAATGAPSDADAGPRRQGRHVKDLALWSRQLCVLVRSGTPLAKALEAVERQIDEGAWREILVDLRAHVSEGASLSEAMGLHAGVFDDVTRSLVAAGESTGKLGPMLDRVATLLRQQLKIRRTLIGAITYPVLLVGVGMVVTLVMLLVVIPRFSELFSTLDAALPPTTKLLMMLSDALRGYWWAGLIGGGAAGFGLKMYLGHPHGRRATHILAVRLPFVGKMVRSLATGRIARLLGVMLEARVPLLEALRLTRYSTGNVLYAELMTEALDRAERGEPISALFSRSNLITPAVAEAIRHGEQNGQIGPIMTDMADFLDEENQVIVKAVMGLLEPLILIVLGLAVGFIALSMFIPLFDLAATSGVK